MTKKTFPVSEVWLGRAKRYGRSDEQILIDAAEHFDLTSKESRRRLRRAGVSMKVHRRMTRRPANTRAAMKGMAFCILLVLLAAVVAYTMAG